MPPKKTDQAFSNADEESIQLHKQLLQHMYECGIARRDEPGSFIVHEPSDGIIILYLLLLPAQAAIQLCLPAVTRILFEKAQPEKENTCLHFLEDSSC